MTIQPNPVTWTEARRERHDVVVLKFIGLLDSPSGTNILKDRVRHFVNSHDRRLIIDLSRCTGTDENGADTLAMIEGEMTELGYPLALLNTPKALETLLKQTRFHGKLRHRFADRETAIDFFS